MEEKLRGNEQKENGIDELIWSFGLRQIQEFLFADDVQLEKAEVNDTIWRYAA